MKKLCATKKKAEMKKYYEDQQGNKTYINQEDEHKS